MTTFLAGPGGFGAGSVVTVGRQPSAIVVRDLDRDGNPDFAVYGLLDEVFLISGDGRGELVKIARPLE